MPAPRKPAHLPGVVHAEIDCLGDVGVCLGPGLAAFVHLPGSQFESLVAHLGCDEFDVFGAVGGIELRPLRFRATGRVNRFGDMHDSTLIGLQKPAVTFRTAEPADYLLDVQQPEEIEPALEQALSHPDGLMESIRHFVAQTHPYRDGRSSERTLDAIDALAESGLQGLTPKPLNLYRHWKMRRMLNYPKYPV